MVLALLSESDLQLSEDIVEAIVDNVRRKKIVFNGFRWIFLLMNFLILLRYNVLFKRS